MLQVGIQMCPILHWTSKWNGSLSVGWLWSTAEWSFRGDGSSPDRCWGFWSGGWKKREARGNLLSKFFHTWIIVWKLVWSVNAKSKNRQAVYLIGYILWHIRFHFLKTSLYELSNAVNNVLLQMNRGTWWESSATGRSSWKRKKAREKKRSREKSLDVSNNLVDPTSAE